MIRRGIIIPHDHVSESIKLNMTRIFLFSDGLEHLEHLKLQSCHYLYDDGLVYLSCVRKSLKALDVSHCTSLTDKALVQHLSALK